MKYLKINILILMFALPMMSCENEIVPPATTQEIISNISKTWTCEMIEDGSFRLNFESIITNYTSDETKIKISNFHNSEQVVFAYVSKDLTITIPEQQVGEQYFKGSGDISNDYSSISWNYTIENANGTVVVTGVFTSGGAI